MTPPLDNRVDNSASPATAAMANIPRALLSNGSTMLPIHQIFALHAWIREDAVQTPADENIWLSDLWRNVPFDWHLTPFQAPTTRDFTSAAAECRAINCPDRTTAGTLHRKESLQDEDEDSSDTDSGTSAPGQTGRSRAAETGWLEITYDPPSAPPGAPAPALLCETRPPAAPSSLLTACDAANAGLAGTFGISFQSDTAEGNIYADSWGISVDIGSGLQINVASDLPDLLQGFSFDEARGTNVRSGAGLQLLGTSASLEVLKQATTPATQFFTGITFQTPTTGLFAGVTLQGPAGGVLFTSGSFGAQIVTQVIGGQLQTAETLAFQSSGLSLGYTFAADGNTLVGRYTRGALDFTVAVASSDVQVGLSYNPKRGPTIQATWSGAGGLEIAIAALFTISDGPGHGPIFELSGDQHPPGLRVGPGNLTVTPPDPWDGPAPPSIDFTWPLPAPRSP